MSASDATFPKLLRGLATKNPDQTALQEKRYGIWQPMSWSTYAARVQDFAHGLAALGGERGQIVAVLGDNRPEWLIAESVSYTHLRSSRWTVASESPERSARSVSCWKAGPSANNCSRSAALRTVPNDPGASCSASLRGGTGTKLLPCRASRTSGPARCSTVGRGNDFHKKHCVSR